MKFTEIGLKILAAKECGLIKSNAEFWKLYREKERLIREILNDYRVINRAESLSERMKENSKDEGIVCFFDEEFPVINHNVRNDSEKPYLLFYKGDLSLLNDLNRNVSVIGHTDPEDNIINREREIVSKLVDKNLVIVSGLAKGCDTISHQRCIEMNGKTIAILPSQISKVIPAKNRELAKSIVDTGGLLISEYFKEANSRSESIKRFVERDRLQAMFSKAIILIASYRKGDGDSGSRHAMQSAKKYKIQRYVMYNSVTDENNIQFGLNRDYIKSIETSRVNVISKKSIDLIDRLVDSNISVKKNLDEQLTLL